MKSTNIFTIAVEGADGVGKTELCNRLRERLNFRFMIQHRGELSNFVYCKKYHRPFAATERHLPILYVFLKCSKSVLKQRIQHRAISERWSMTDTESELAKIDDEDLFEIAAKQFEQDYNIITIDTTDLSIEEVYDVARRKILAIIEDPSGVDSSVSSWNEMYKIGCDKLGLNFYVKNNQPYINGIAFMSESTLQNGVYETFSDKSYPDNLIYSLAYDVDTSNIMKEYDFCYIINSKLNRRKKVIDYMTNLSKYSILTSDHPLIPSSSNIIKTKEKVFGNDFIKLLAKAKATVYCCPDLEYLKLQTARLYESILANQIVFVDKSSDVDCEILKLIYKDRQDLIDLLYVDVDTIAINYQYILDNDIIPEILRYQSEFYADLKKTDGGLFNV